MDGQGGNDQVIVNDRGAGVGSDGDWTLDGATLDKTNPDPGKMLSWAGVEQLRLDGGSAGTTYTVKSLDAGTAVTMNAGAGDDTFNVGSPAGSDRNVDGVRSALFLNGESGNNSLSYNDQDNGFLPLTIILPGRLRENPRGDAYTITPTTVTRDRSAVVTYGGVQTLHSVSVALVRSLPLYAVFFAVIAFCILFPDIVLWLPKHVLPESVGCFKNPAGGGYICPG